MNDLKHYRNLIDKIDKIIIENLVERLIICEKIGQFKYENNLEIKDINRFSQILENKIEIIIGLGYNENFIIELYNVIHKYSIEIQKKL